MNISAATTTIGLINSTVQTAKTAIELAKHSKDSDLKHAVSEVLDQILNLKETILDLDEQNRAMKQQIAARTEVERRGEFGYWYKRGESDPLCPKCYEEGSKQIYLPPSEPWSGGIRRDCRVCHHVYWEKPMGQATVTVGRKYDPYSGIL